MVWRKTNTVYDGKPLGFPVAGDLENDFIFGKKKQFNFKLHEFGNPVSQTSTNYDNGEVTFTSESIYTYEYDSWNFPVKCTETRSNGVVTEFKFEYY